MRKTYASSLDGLYRTKFIRVVVMDDHPNYKEGVVTFRCYYLNNWRDAGRVGRFEHLPQDVKEEVRKDFNILRVNNEWHSHSI